MTQQQPRARRDDPTTSQEAAATARNPDKLRTRIQDLMANDGGWMSHDYVIAVYKVRAAISGWPPASPSGIRTRVSELHERGYLEQDSTPTARNLNGRRVHQWRFITDPARRAQIRAAHGRARLNTGPARYLVGERGVDFLTVCPVGTVVLGCQSGRVSQRLTPGLWAAPFAPEDYKPNPQTPGRSYRVLYVPAGAATDAVITAYLDLPTTPAGD